MVLAPVLRRDRSRSAGATFLSQLRLCRLVPLRHAGGWVPPPVSLPSLPSLPLRFAGGACAPPRARRTVSLPTPISAAMARSDIPQQPEMHKTPRRRKPAETFEPWPGRLKSTPNRSLHQRSRGHGGGISTRWSMATRESCKAGVTPQRFRARNPIPRRDECSKKFREKFWENVGEIEGGEGKWTQTGEPTMIPHPVAVPLCEACLSEAAVSNLSLPR